MSPGMQVFLSGALTFGGPLLVAAHELIALRRGNDGFWRPDPPVVPIAPLPPTGGVTGKPLPACLIPVLPPVRAVPRDAPARMLEPAG